MSVSDVDICNVALAMLGEEGILNFTEDNVRSRLCKVLYDFERDYLLGKGDWSFAREVRQLQQLAASNPLGEEYQIPSDALLPIKIHPRFAQRYTWRIMGNRIVVPISIVGSDNQVSVYLEYTKQETNAALFTPSFSSALAVKVAARLAPTLVQKEQTVRRLLEESRIRESEALAEDANRGDDYRRVDENPEADTFVFPDGVNPSVGYFDEMYIVSTVI